MKEKLTANILFSGIGCQERGIINSNLFDLNVISTSDIDKEAIVSYAAIHNGLTNEMINTYENYPLKEQMVKELTDMNIGYDPEKKKNYDWFKLIKRKTNELNKYWLACKISNQKGDISRITEMPYADLWTISFCCQDISIAGKMKGLKPDSETRSSLLWTNIKLLKDSIDKGESPKYLMFENVKNLVSKKFIDDFNNLLEVLDELGFNTYWQVLNGKECGIPQNRERVFVICIRKDVDNNKFSFPKPFDNGLRLKDVLEDEVDEKYYLSKQVQDRFQITDETFTKNIVGTTKPEFRTIGQRDLVYQENSVMGALVATDYKQPKQIIETNRCIQSGNLTGGKWDKIYESARRYYSTEGVSPTLHTCGGGNTETKIIEDQTYIDNISDEYSFAKRKAQKMLDDNGKLPEMFNPYNNYEVTDYAPTQTACCDRSASTATVLRKEGNGCIRKLTPKEYWKLMGLTFEDCNKARNLGVADCNLYKQAGNGIITNCVELIMEHLYKAQYDGTYICTDENFTQPQVD